MAGGERGFAALWVIGALAVSAAVGVGVYVAIKQARLAAAADDVAETRTAPPPASEPGEPTGTPAEPTEPRESQVDAREPPAPAPTSEDRWRTPDKSGTLYAPIVSGALDAEAVSTTLQAAIPKLRQCEVVLGGRIGVTLEINRRGGVTNATAEGADEALGTCAVKVLQQIRFARTTDGGTASVFVPLAFQRPAAPCDEVSCVLDNYSGPCCAQYKRGGGTPTAGTDAPTREEIMTALRPDRAAVSACAVASNFEGTLKVRFTIAPDGTVSKIGIADAEPPLVGCVARVIRKHTFSATKNGASVSFPFTVPQ